MVRASVPPRRQALLGIAAFVAMTLPLGACVTSKPPKLAVCDGKHRRDANPYGTVLPGVPIPASTAPRGKAAPSASDGHADDLHPPPPPPADKISAATQTLPGSC